MGFSRYTGLLLLLVSCLSFGKPLPIVVEDDSGNAVKLQEPAKKIISLAPHITELLFEAGAGDHLIGAVEYSDYPAAAQELPRVGSYVSFSVEKIIDMEPDLVVAYTAGNHPDQLRLLESAGITLYRSNPKTIPEVISNIRKLGQVTGHKADADKHADQLQQRYEKLIKQYQNTKPVSTFIQIWHDPLMSVSNDHIIGQSLELCGGRNLFPDLPSTFSNVSLESVIAGSPQAILLMEAHGSGKPDEAIVKSWNRMDSHIFSIDENLLYRASGRLIEGTEMLCEKLDHIRRSIKRVKP